MKVKINFLSLLTIRIFLLFVEVSILKVENESWLFFSLAGYWKNLPATERILFNVIVPAFLLNHRVLKSIILLYI